MVSGGQHYVSGCRAAGAELVLAADHERGKVGTPVLEKAKGEMRARFKASVRIEFGHGDDIARVLELFELGRRGYRAHSNIDARVARAAR